MPKPDEYPNLAMMQMFELPVDDSTTYFPTIAYGASKTANVLFGVALNDRLYEKHGILSVAVNPGEIKTELGRNTDPNMLESMLAKAEQFGMKWKTLQQGSSTTLVAAVSDAVTLPGEDGMGAFWSDCQPKPAPPYATKKGLANKLWEVSEGWTGEKFAW
jgi:NAD(P)-dependent dehydrogenase (short-subunit alcohol dehydrogenase family)